MSKGEKAMRSKKMVAAVGILIALGWFGPALANNLKIGSVDIQKAVNESNPGKEAKKAIVKEAEKFQRQIADKQKELQAMKESLDKQAPMLNPDVRSTKERELQNRVREFQRWQEDTNNELNQKKMEMERHISLGLQKVIQKLGADEGYTFIIEEGSVPFVTKTIDVTDRVIKVFDAQKK